MLLTLEENLFFIFYYLFHLSFVSANFGVIHVFHQEALDIVQITKEDQEHAFSMLAAVLWLGNISFQVVDSENHVEVVANEGKLFVFGFVCYFCDGALHLVCFGCLISGFQHLPLVVIISDFF